MSRFLAEVLPRFISRMEELLGPLFHDLIEFFSRLLPAFAIGIVRIIDLARTPTVLALFFGACLIFLGIAYVTVGLHLAIVKRRARVFISYQHERESVADNLINQMEASGIDAKKLPFLKDPNHDTLLDDVQQSIRTCNVFVCVPGKRPSFVENEVSMAFALEKPLLFILSETETPHLPNTAKKGYPIFALERLQKKGFRALSLFCQYLAVDRTSTMRLYETILQRWLKFAGMVIAIYFIGISIMVFALGDAAGVGPIGNKNVMQWIETAIIDPPTLVLLSAWIGSLFILIGGFVSNQMRLRARVRRVIAGERFNNRFLPMTLDVSLAKETLLELFYQGDLLAEHESRSVRTEAPLDESRRAGITTTEPTA